MVEKPIVWLGASLADLKAPVRWPGTSCTWFSWAWEPNDAKPMASVGAGVHEIRIHTGVERRVFSRRWAGSGS